MAQGLPQDDYVQIAPDGSGKKMDNAALTRDDGTVVERERVSIGSDENPRLLAQIGNEYGRGSLYIGGEAVELLTEINHTLKMILVLFCMSTGEDLDAVRDIVSINEVG